MLFDAIRYNLSHLTDFSGRDARSTFWYHVLFLVLVQFVVGIIVSIPLYIAIFSTAFNAASDGGVTDQETLMRDMMAGMVDQLETQMWVGSIIGVVMVALFLASFVRRLHDGGFTGWIAILPTGLYLFGIAYAIYTFDDLIRLIQDTSDPAVMGNAMAFQAEVAPLSFIGYLSYLIVIGFGLVPSNIGPNKYGEEPVGF